MARTASLSSGVRLSCLLKKHIDRTLLKNLARTLAIDAEKSKINSFKHKELIVKADNRLKQKPDWENLRFGASFSDHMFEVLHTTNGGWEKPRIVPFHDLVLHPAAKVLHYAVELFEGLKAYRGIDNKIRLFRPELNMERMILSARRACLPDFDAEELLKCIVELVRIEQEWVPYSSVSSLYIRPTVIGIDPTLGVAQSNVSLLYVIVGPVGAYFPTGFKPIGLYADSEFARSWTGGAGQYKLGSNYGPTILPHRKALENGCQQVLWLFGPDDQITEVGTMNLFLYWKNEKGEEELVTPPLDSGLILPGITRRTILELAREWSEFKVSERPVTMSEIIKALKENRVMQIFGAGTACIVCPVNRILFKKNGALTDYHIPTMEHKSSLIQKFWDTITGIQYGRISKPGWTRIVPTKANQQFLRIRADNKNATDDSEAENFKVITA